MKLPAHAVSVDIDVPFHDCDPLFVVWHGRYFEYLEAGRTALMRSCDLDVPVIRQMGYRMFIADVRCRYTYPLSYGDTARVTAWVLERTPLIRVAYVVQNLTQGRRSARATTVLATTDGQGRLIPETPREIVERMPQP
ncbi:MAG: acyl-CoA thioesterase [Deltaproteobacteria bacterium]|nr:acyl-CoA thioesterase [Deltaproteobacteria bacterium]MCB9786248.1 acyl-CoA thioesterase [Deltaproteobacteria bacterium]